MKELPLIIFTLTMQAAIGAFLWATVIRLIDKNAPVLKTNTLVALILSAVGMVASLMHLGKPMLALTSMSNITSSWLSREIFFSGGFLVLLLVFWWLERLRKVVTFQTVLALLVCIAGLASVSSMALLYMKSIIPAWQSANTLVDFYATTLILGAMVFYMTAGPEGRKKLPRFELVVLGVVLLQITFLPGYTTSLGAVTGAGQESAALLVGGYGAAVFSRWLLILGGIFLFVLSRTGRFITKSNFLYLSITVLIVGEFVGRYLFYASGIPIGIGMI